MLPSPLPCYGPLTDESVVDQLNDASRDEFVFLLSSKGDAPAVLLLLVLLLVPMLAGWCS